MGPTVSAWYDKHLFAKILLFSSFCVSSSFMKPQTTVPLFLGQDGTSAQTPTVLEPLMSVKVYVCITLYFIFSLVNLPYVYLISRPG